MAASSSTVIKTDEVKTTLKIMVNKNTNKVVFAEAGKEFIDFLLQLLSLPLATVVKLLNTKDNKISSLRALYKSMEYLDTKYFENNGDKDSALKPKTAVYVPMLSLNETPTTLTYYKCATHNCISDVRGTTCPYCRGYMPEFRCAYVALDTTSSPLANAGVGYVKGVVNYMVMDNLEVKPMSVSVIKSHVESFDSLVEEEVQFGCQEGLAMLKASLETDSVLTAVFLGNKINNVGASATANEKATEESDSDDDLGFSLFD